MVATVDRDGVPWSGVSWIHHILSLKRLKGVWIFCYSPTLRPKPSITPLLVGSKHPPTADMRNPQNVGSL